VRITGIKYKNKRNIICIDIEVNIRSHASPGGLSKTN
jgi:hypothetical protein